MKYLANDKKAAWAIADELFPSDYVHDSSRSQRAGYDVYMSTFPGMDAWISDLGDRLEVNLPDGQTVNVWIEDGETAAARRAIKPAALERVADDPISLGFLTDLHRHDIRKAAVRLTIAAVLQYAEDVTAARRPRANAARLGDISRRASSMYRAMIQQDPAAAGRASWYASMKEAAQEVKGEEALDRLTLDDMELALDGEAPEELRRQVIEALRHGAMKCPKWAQTRTRIDRETGEKVLAPSSCALWMGTRETWPESVDHIVAEAWASYLARSIKRAKEQGKGPGAVIFWSTFNACQRIDYEHNPHKRSKRSPEQRAALELRMIGGRPADPEAAALAMDIVDRAAPSPADRLALELTAAGYTQSDIAARLEALTGQPVTQSTVSRIIKRIRDRADLIMHG